MPSHNLVDRNTDLAQIISHSLSIITHPEGNLVSTALTTYQEIELAGGGLRNHPQVWLIQAARLGTCKFMPAGSPALTNIPKHSQLENGPTCSAFMLADSYTPTSASLATHIPGLRSNTFQTRVYNTALN